MLAKKASPPGQCRQPKNLPVGVDAHIDPQLMGESVLYNRYRQLRAISNVPEGAKIEPFGPMWALAPTRNGQICLKLMTLPFRGAEQPKVPAEFRKPGKCIF